VLPRILFIVENNTVPPDIRVWREALTIQKAGYTVTVISPKKASYSKYYEIIDNIEIYRHPSFESKGGKIYQVLEYANALIWELLICVRLMFGKRFEIIHGANPPDHLFLIASLFKIFGVKFIFDHHDLAPELYLCKFGSGKNLIHRLLRLMEKLSCHTANVIISTNQSYKGHIISKYKINPKKIFVVRNDPEIPNLEKTIERTLQKNSSIIKLLYVGSINKQDGVDLLIRALHILVSQINQSQIHCTVVGDGDDLTHIKTLCTELGIDPYLNFTGYIYDRKVVHDFIEDADICLETAPYNEVNAKSTFIKIMEYMAAGKPIVAFDLDETRYSAQNSALLVEQGNLKAFAEAIQKLILKPDLREKLGKAGQTRIIEELNWTNASRELLAAYQYVSSPGGQ